MRGQKLSSKSSYSIEMKKMVNTRYGIFPQKLQEEECRLRYREWLKGLPLEEIAAHLWIYRSRTASAPLAPDQRFRLEALKEEYRRRENRLLQRCA